MTENIKITLIGWGSIILMCFMICYTFVFCSDLEMVRLKVRVEMIEKEMQRKR